jgi:hypothetical protein
VTTESVNGKKNALRRNVRSDAPRLSATASASGMARMGSVLATA